MRLRLVSALGFLLVCFMTDPALASSQTPGNRLGVVDFRTSCVPETEDNFNRAVALLN